MERLEEEITHHGRTLRQIKRTGKSAIYELRNKGNMLYGYEVIRIRISPAREIYGKFYPEREAYPGNEQWGSLAWSFGARQRQAAMACFNGLVKQEGSTVPVAIETVLELNAEG